MKYSINEFSEIMHEKLPKYQSLHVAFILPDGSKDHRRVGTSIYNSVMIYHKGSKKYGFLFTNEFFSCYTHFEIKENKEKNIVSDWEKSWKRVLKYLQASGLWQDMAKEIELALEIGYEKINKASQLYWNYSVETIRDIDPRLLNGQTANTNILWYMDVPAKIKTIYFGKYYTEGNRAQIRDALKNKTPLNLWGRDSYDITYTFAPASMKAWYSEEYRGCGNGHYYLALDDTHALFYEDD